MHTYRGGGGQLWVSSIKRAEQGGVENRARDPTTGSPKKWPDVASYSSDSDETWCNRRSLMRRNQMLWFWLDPIASAPHLRAL